MTGNNINKMSTQTKCQGVLSQIPKMLALTATPSDTRRSQSGRRWWF